MKISIIIIIIIFLLSGCWNYQEIDKQLVASGIAIDKGHNGKKFHITAEIVDVETGGKDIIRSTTAENDADTLFDGFRGIITQSSKKLYLGHCQIFIISEEVAKDEITSIVDFIMRNHEIRKDVDILIAKEKPANEILSQKPLASVITMYSLRDLLDNNEKYLSETQRAVTYKLVNILGSDGASPVIPAFVVKKIKDKTVYSLSGLAVFKKDKLLGFLDTEESRALLFITDDIQGGYISAKSEDKKEAFMAGEVFDNKTTYDPVYKDDKLTMKIKTETTIGIEEINKDIDFTSKSKLAKINKQFKNKLKTDIEDLIKKVQKEYGSDIFEFSSIINRKNPKLWKKLKDKWEETYRSMEVKLDVKIIIKGSGTSNKPIKIGGKKVNS